MLCYEAEYKPYVQVFYSSRSVTEIQYVKYYWLHWPVKGNLSI